MSRRGPVVLFAGLLVLVAIVQWLPYVRAERPHVSSTPVVRGAVGSELRLGRGQEVCIDGVEFSPRAQAARLVARRTTGAGPPIELSARADGYRAQGTAPGGYASLSQLDIEFAAAPTTLAGGTLCLRNAGRASVSLLANDDPRSLASQSVTVDGEPTTKQVVVTLQERRPHPIIARAGTLLEHLGAFRPFPVGIVTLWLLVVSVLIGVPLLVGGALVRALREDRPA